MVEVVSTGTVVVPDGSVVETEAAGLADTNSAVPKPTRIIPTRRRSTMLSPLWGIVRPCPAGCMKQAALGHFCGSGGMSPGQAAGTRAVPGALDCLGCVPGAARAPMHMQSGLEESHHDDRVPAPTVQIQPAADNMSGPRIDFLCVGNRSRALKVARCLQGKGPACPM